MKYYAVTNDPTELMHYGIKGMKWGVIRSDAQLGHPKKPRSAAYNKASKKLSGLVKSGIKRTKAKWKVYNSPINKQIRQERREERQLDRAYNRQERAFQKHVELARQGRLKYKGISDNEVQRITDRLALERTSRSLSGTEKAGYGHRIKEAIGEGVVQGIGRATTAYIEERGRGRGRTTAEIKADKRLDKYNAKMKTQQRKQKRAIAEEYYKVTAEEADTPNYIGSKARAKYLADVKKRNKENEYRANISKIYDEQQARSQAVKDAEREAARRAAARNNATRLGGRAVARLNAYNDYHERMDQYGNNWLDSVGYDNPNLPSTTGSTRKRKRKGRR